MNKATADEHVIETYRSMLNIGVEATKSMVLLNGGAIVALLAYLGQIPDRADVAQQTRQPIAAFVVGLALGCFSFLFGYLTQHALFNESEGRPLRVPHQVWQWLTVTLLVVSMVSFSIGAFMALGALGTTPPETAPTAKPIPVAASLSSDDV